MSVGLLLVTHEKIGEQILEAARTAMGEPLPNAALCISPDHPPERISAAVAAEIQRLDQGDGVLVLCDLYGATPCNRVCIACEPGIRIVTGCNLPMVLKVFNYASLDLHRLADKAVEGGRTGILGIAP